jgi:hypothetical protein
MNCPFLSGRQIKLCGAFEATLVLDVEELNHKCSNVLHQECKLYKKRLQSSDQLNIIEYGKDQILPTV